MAAVTTNLWELGVGSSARIKPYNASLPMVRRLMDIGFTERTEVKCVLAAPSGEPKAYLVRGSVIALRREDAQLIETAARTLQ